MKQIIPLLKTSSLSESELALAVSLQGLLAQKGKTFLLDCDHYRQFIEGNSFSVRPVFLGALIAENKNLIPGYVLFDFSRCDGSLNAANMLTSAKGYLAVPSECESFVSGLLPCVRDLREEDPATIQETIFDECLPFFRKDGLIHQVERDDNHKINLRDYGIRNHWAIVYGDESEKGRKFLGHEAITAYLWLLFPLAWWGVFFLFAFVRGFVFSFTNLTISISKISRFTFEQYTRLFADDVFWTAFRNTIIWTLVMTALNNGLGLFVAYLISRIHHDGYVFSN